MFDLITGTATHAPRNQTVPILVSIGVHLSVIGTLLGVTVLVVGNPIPAVPQMMQAFIAAPPPPPPPPPPPAPAPERPKDTRPVATAGNAVPIEPPRTIEPELPVIASGDEEGVLGGVEGGVPGGVITGVIGGVVDVPQPPPAPAPRVPVRVGGDVRAPALLRRVEPVYPPVAVQAHIEGMVILEATVNEQGAVEDVRVLRSHKVLDAAAIAAVRQWQYSPLLLNGHPSAFVLTVVLSFSLTDS